MAAKAGANPERDRGTAWRPCFDHQCMGDRTCPDRSTEDAVARPPGAGSGTRGIPERLMPMDDELRSPPYRRRLPNRRPAITETIAVGNTTISASVGFGPDGRPQEIFLSGAKDGSSMAAILDDASVVISVALQFGISSQEGPAAGCRTVAMRRRGISPSAREFPHWVQSDGKSFHSNPHFLPTAP
jgi:hypothetical protein